MVIKYEEQTTMKQEETTVPPDANTGRWKQQKPQCTPALCKNYNFYKSKDRTDCQFYTSSLLNVRLKIYVQSRGYV
jgi:hypothetical protein